MSLVETDLGLTAHWVTAHMCNDTNNNKQSMSSHSDIIQW